jgi:crotonobetaine/carnitine-CoA ligase
MNAKELEKDLQTDGEVVVHKFEEFVREHPEKLFFYYGENDRKYSYGEFNELANSVAHSLRSMDVTKGDRVSLFLKNPLVTSLAMFGIWKIGAIYCPINFNYQGRLLSYQVTDTTPKLLVTEQGRVSLLNHVKDDVPKIPVILHTPERGDHDHDSGEAAVELDAKFERVAFAELLNGEKANLNIPLGYADIANIIYTSGTTGLAKGVVQAHRWMHNYCYYYLKLMHPDDVVYNDLPLYHVAGSFANIARAAWTGCAVAVWDRFSPFEFWQRINKCGATSCILIDVMIPWLLLPEESPDDRRNTLKQIHMQPLPEYHHSFARRFGIDFISIGYGQTEAGAGCAGIVDEWGDEAGTPKELYKGYSKEEGRKIIEKVGLRLIPGNKPIRKGFMGKPAILFEAAVLDENDEELGPNQHGQFALRPKLPAVLFNEYFNKPEATLKTFRNLWFHTGDGVYRDEEGYFYYVDRMGGFIRRRGENISSYQVEDILLGNPKVGMCAAFPIPADEGLEDDIVVYVVAKEELSEEELRNWIDREMPKFMRPKHLRFVDSLPQTPTYKVEKYKLKEQFLREQET